MANTVTKTIIEQGPKWLIAHFYLASDGSSGELSGQVLLDPAVDLSPVHAAGPAFALHHIRWNFTGFAGTLAFKATANQQLWQLDPQGETSQCFRDYEITDKSTTGATGQLILTTQGFTAATDIGTLIVKLRVLNTH